MTTQTQADILREAVREIMAHQFTHSRAGMHALQVLIDEAEAAADELDRLRDELDLCCSLKRQYQEGEAAAKEEADRLRAENARLVADAGRYRWLRRWKGQQHEPLFTVQHELDGTLWGVDLDDEIDASMKDSP